MQQQLLRPSDDAETIFGEAVVLDGSTLAVLRQSDRRIFIFVQQGGTWIEQASFLASNDPADYRFTLALDADTLVVGVLDGNDQDEVKIFRRSGLAWALEQTLPGCCGNEDFGYAVAVEGDRLCVTRGNPPPPGIVEVWHRSGSTWTLEASLTGPPQLDQQRPADDAVFHGDTLAVSNQTVGRVWLWRHDGVQWLATPQIVQAAGVAITDQCGEDIDLDGNTLIMGARGDDSAGTDGGAVYVFTRSNGIWSFSTKLYACMVPHFGGFGWAVALEGNTIAARAAAAVYVLTNTGSGWSHRQMITADVGAGEFGKEIALDSGVLVGAARTWSSGYPDAGAVYVFARELPAASNFCFGDGSGGACPCGNSGAAGHGCAHSFNAAGARLDAYGAARLSDDRLKLASIAGPPGFIALFFQGTAKANGGLGFPTADGLRCVAGSLVRLGIHSECDGNISYPPGQLVPLSIQGGIPAGGGTFYYQAWFRNLNGPCGGGSNYTNAVEVLWTP